MINHTKIGYILLLLFALLSCNIAVAQQRSNLVFLNTEADYGHVAEDGGGVECQFLAVNSGCDTIYIREVVATCGCTTPRYAQREVSPSDTLRLSVGFDPMNRPGRIDKSIYVGVSDSDQPIKLSLVGYVLPREKSVEELYPFDMGGGLRLRSNFHAFGYVEHGKSVEERIGYVNTSDSDVVVSLSSELLSGALVVEYPERIASGESGDIVLRYELLSDSNVYGVLEDRFSVVVDGQAAPYAFSCQAVAVDNFDLQDDISAPRADISKKIIKFGEVNSHNAVLEHSVELINVGASPLILRATASTEGAVSVVADDALAIEAGGSQTIVVRLDARLIEDGDNPFVARIMLITNDPIRPMLSLRVNALPAWREE